MIIVILFNDIRVSWNIWKIMIAYFIDFYKISIKTRFPLPRIDSISKEQWLQLDCSSSNPQQSPEHDFWGTFWYYFLSCFPWGHFFVFFMILMTPGLLKFTFGDPNGSQTGSQKSLKITFGPKSDLLKTHLKSVPQKTSNISDFGSPGTCRIELRL